MARDARLPSVISIEALQAAADGNLIEGADGQPAFDDGISSDVSCRIQNGRIGIAEGASVRVRLGAGAAAAAVRAWGRLCRFQPQNSEILPSTADVYLQRAYTFWASGFRLCAKPISKDAR